MKPSPKVSIIIPVYNTGKILNCALDSALGQTLREIEVIAVDDGSTDPESPEILSGRAAADERLRVFRQNQNSGTWSARRRGILESRGDYLLFLDPDDFLETTAAKELSALADREKADIIHFGTREFTRAGDGTMKVLHNAVAPQDRQISGPGAVLRNLLTGGHNWAIGFKMIRGAICRRVAAETEDFYCVMGEDLYFCLAAEFYAETMLQIGKPFYHYDTTAGVTAVRTVSPAQFRRTATLLDALARSESLLREKRILDDPVCADGWTKILRGQYLILWNRWYSRLSPGSRGETAGYLVQHAHDKETFLLALFDENDYLRENEEFLRFARTIYGLLNRIFPKNSRLRLKLKTWYKKRKASGKEPA